MKKLIVLLLIFIQFIVSLGYTATVSHKDSTDFNFAQTYQPAMICNAYDTGKHTQSTVGTHSAKCSDGRVIIGIKNISQIDQVITCGRIKCKFQKGIKVSAPGLAIFN